MFGPQENLIDKNSSAHLMKQIFRKYRLVYVTGPVCKNRILEFRAFTEILRPRKFIHRHVGRDYGTRFNGWGEEYRR